MLKIKNTISLVALLCGTFIYFGTPEKALAQAIPPGSYQKSCKNIKVTGSSLDANCNRKGDTLGDKIAGKSFVYAAPLEDYYLCDGDIWNDDSVLKCNKNMNSALMQKNAKAIENAYNFATGQNAYFTGTSVISYVRDLFKKGMGDQFFEGKYGFANMNLNKYFIDWLSEPKNATTKADSINKAFVSVYGYGPSPTQLAFYNAQKVGYKQVVELERKKLSSDKIIRRLMILSVYKRTMGRPPKNPEYDYWTTKTEIYDEMVAASRAFLYAPNGAKDLAETVKRALADHGNDNPSIQQINQAIVKYSQKKAIFDEM